MYLQRRGSGRKSGASLYTRKRLSLEPAPPHHGARGHLDEQLARHVRRQRVQAVVVLPQEQRAVLHAAPQLRIQSKFCKRCTIRQPQALKPWALSSFNTGSDTVGLQPGIQILGRLDLGGLATS